MEETSALVFKYKCRRNMFVARPAICTPVVQPLTPIVSFHHRPAREKIDGKESHAPIVAALNPLRKVLRPKVVAKEKNEPKQNEIAREKAAQATNKEVTLEFQKSYNSSLHLNVSPTSSIQFDRRDSSSRIKLLAVVQCGEKEKRSKMSTLKATSPKCVKLLLNSPEDEEDKPTSLKSPGQLNDTAMQLPLWTKVSHFQGDSMDNERQGSVGDIVTLVSEEPRPIQSAVCVSGDEKLISQPFEVKKAAEFGAAVSHQRVVVRQLPLSYSLNDETSKLAPVSRGIQCSNQSDSGEREEGNTAPPSRNTAPDSPYVSLYKGAHATRKPVCYCHTHSQCIRQRDVNTWTVDEKVGGKRGPRVSKVMQTDPPMHDKSTQYKGCIARQSEKVQTANHLSSRVQRSSHASQTSAHTAFEMWDTATISDNSQISTDPLSWYFDKLKLQRRCKSRESRCKLKRCRIHPVQSAFLDCQGDHSSHDYQQRQRRRIRTCLPNTSSVSTQTPRKLASSRSLPTPTRQKRGSESVDLKWWAGRPSVTRSATKSPRNRHCTILSPQAKRKSPMVRRVVKSGGQASLRNSYQMHTFSSILKRRNPPRTSLQSKNST